jgi:hypothetical protein
MSDIIPTRYVLSLWQPWATLVVTDDPLRRNQAPCTAKRFETRAFDPEKKKKLKTPIQVAIHATKREDQLPRDPIFVETLNRLGYWHGRPRDLPLTSTLKPLPFGALIGVGEITAVMDAERLAKQWADHIAKIPERMIDGRFVQGIMRELHFGDFSRGRFAWLMLAMRPLPYPIPFTGRQDVLYPLDDKINARIERQFV